MSATNVCDCGARMRWATTLTGSRIPLDPEPVDDGTFLLVAALEPAGAPIAIPVAAIADDRIMQLRQAGPRLFRSHFATCPNADDHRKRGST